jgi:hypothetical protein
MAALGVSGAIAVRRWQIISKRFLGEYSISLPRLGKY